MKNVINKKVILFIPEIGVYSFAQGLTILGDSIKKQRKDVLITKCTGQMIRCPMMVMHNIAEGDFKRKSRLCKKCNRLFKSAQKKYGFKTIELANFVSEGMIKDIEKNITENIDDLEKITYKKFPVGKISQYDFILETKFPHYKNLSTKHEAIYLSCIRNTSLSLALADRICAHYKPDLLITFNEYAQCQAIRYSASINNINRLAMTYPVHFNVAASRFMVWRSSCEYWRYKHCQNWDKGKNLPINHENIIACWEDSVFRMYNSGSHIFSSQKKEDPFLAFKKLKLSQNKKTIIVYPSSQDERSSVEVAMKIWGENNHLIDVFNDQIEWLLILKDYARKHDDIQIIVRIHPREGLRQFGFESKHLKELRKNFTDNDGNFIIIWPDDPISSYDLIELADVCLVTWSLMGQEAVRLGIPVLSCTGNMFYPNDDFIQVATNPEEYKEKLGSILNMKYTWQHLLKAIRFYHWRTFIPSLDLGETVPMDTDDHNLWPEAPSSKIDVINDILEGKIDLIEHNIKEWKDSLSENSEKEESEAVQKGIRYFIDKIFYPPSTSKTKNDLFRIKRLVWRRITGKTLSLPQTFFKDYRLEYSQDVSKMNHHIKRTKEDKKLRIVLADGPWAILINKGKIKRRMSPVINRLAKLHHTSINHEQEKI
jgi:hypothetical protein